ncbi:hypothetical protein TIFTF001_053825 [Ficus carica]|uniref:Uncharacterized protein n=1 Tax=Ficus carica TaxID=3494 RepID=A0AA88ENX9_FICCA|nr:hypothetical protein TIFTF001_053825 [Ficus carica]
MTRQRSGFRIGVRFRNDGRALFLRMHYGTGVGVGFRNRNRGRVSRQRSGLGYETEVGVGFRDGGSGSGSKSDFEIRVGPILEQGSSLGFGVGVEVGSLGWVSRWGSGSSWVSGRGSRLGFEVRGWGSGWR